MAVTVKKLSRLDRIFLVVALLVSLVIALFTLPAVSANAADPTAVNNTTPGFSSVDPQPAWATGCNVEENNRKNIDTTSFGNGMDAKTAAQNVTVAKTENTDGTTDWTVTFFPNYGLIRNSIADTNYYSGTAPFYDLARARAGLAITRDLEIVGDKMSVGAWQWGTDYYSGHGNRLGNAANDYLGRKADNVKVDSYSSTAATRTGGASLENHPGGINQGSGGDYSFNNVSGTDTPPDTTALANYMGQYGAISSGNVHWSSTTADVNKSFFETGASELNDQTPRAVYLPNPFATSWPRTSPLYGSYLAKLMTPDQALSGPGLFSGSITANQSVPNVFADNSSGAWNRSWFDRALTFKTTGAWNGDNPNARFVVKFKTQPKNGVTKNKFSGVVAAVGSFQNAQRIYAGSLAGSLADKDTTVSNRFNTYKITVQEKFNDLKDGASYSIPSRKLSIHRDKFPEDTASAAFNTAIPFTPTTVDKANNTVTKTLYFTDKVQYCHTLAQFTRTLTAKADNIRNFKTRVGITTGSEADNEAIITMDRTLDAPTFVGNCPKRPTGDDAQTNTDYNHNVGFVYSAKNHGNPWFGGMTGGNGSGDHTAEQGREALNNMANVQSVPDPDDPTLTDWTITFNQGPSTDTTTGYTSRPYFNYGLSKDLQIIGNTTFELSGELNTGNTTQEYRTSKEYNIPTVKENDEYATRIPTREYVSIPKQGEPYYGNHRAYLEDFTAVGVKGSAATNIIAGDGDYKNRGTGLTGLSLASLWNWQSGPDYYDYGPNPSGQQKYLLGEANSYDKNNQMVSAPFAVNGAPQPWQSNTLFRDLGGWYLTRLSDSSGTRMEYDTRKTKVVIKFKTRQVVPEDWYSSTDMKQNIHRSYVVAEYNSYDDDNRYTGGNIRYNTREYTKPDNRKFVTDNHGLKYYFEVDSDGDGISDANEMIIGSNPCVVDTDNDSKTDAYNKNTSAGLSDYYKNDITKPQSITGYSVKGADDRHKLDTGMGQLVTMIEGTDPTVAPVPMGELEYSPYFNFNRGDTIKGHTEPYRTVDYVVNDPTINGWLAPDGRRDPTDYSASYGYWQRGANGRTGTLMAQTIADENGNFTLTIGKKLKLINQYDSKYVEYFCGQNPGYCDGPAHNRHVKSQNGAMDTGEARFELIDGKPQPVYEDISGNLPIRSLTDAGIDNEGLYIWSNPVVSANLKPPYNESQGGYTLNSSPTSRRFSGINDQAFQSYKLAEVSTRAVGQPLCQTLIAVSDHLSGGDGTDGHQPYTTGSEKQNIVAMLEKHYAGFSRIDEQRGDTVSVDNQGNATVTRHSAGRTYTDHISSKDLIFDYKVRHVSDVPPMLQLEKLTNKGAGISHGLHLSRIDADVEKVIFILQPSRSAPGYSYDASKVKGIEIRRDGQNPNNWVVTRVMKPNPDDRIGDDGRYNWIDDPDSGTYWVDTNATSDPAPKGVDKGSVANDIYLEWDPDTVTDLNDYQASADAYDHSPQHLTYAGGENTDSAISGTVSQICPTDRGKFGFLDGPNRATSNDVDHIITKISNLPNRLTLINTPGKLTEGEKKEVKYQFCKGNNGGQVIRCLSSNDYVVKDDGSITINRHYGSGSGAETVTETIPATQTVYNLLKVEDPTGFTTDAGKAFSQGVVYSPELSINSKPNDDTGAYPKRDSDKAVGAGWITQQPTTPFPASYYHIAYPGGDKPVAGYQGDIDTGMIDDIIPSEFRAGKGYFSYTNTGDYGKSIAGEAVSGIAPKADNKTLAEVEAAYRKKNKLDDSKYDNAFSKYNELFEPNSLKINPATGELTGTARNIAQLAAAGLPTDKEGNYVAYVPVAVSNALATDPTWPDNLAGKQLPDYYQSHIYFVPVKVKNPMDLTLVKYIHGGPVIDQDMPNPVPDYDSYVSMPNNANKTYADYLEWVNANKTTPLAVLPPDTKDFVVSYKFTNRAGAADVHHFYDQSMQGRQATLASAKLNGKTIGSEDKAVTLLGQGLASSLNDTTRNSRSLAMACFGRNVPDLVADYKGDMSDAFPHGSYLVFPNPASGTKKSYFKYLRAQTPADKTASVDPFVVYVPAGTKDKPTTLECNLKTNISANTSHRGGGNADVDNSVPVPDPWRLSNNRVWNSDPGDKFAPMNSAEYVTVRGDALPSGTAIYNQKVNQDKNGFFKLASSYDVMRESKYFRLPDTGNTGLVTWLALLMLFGLVAGATSAWAARKQGGDS